MRFWLAAGLILFSAGLAVKAGEPVLPLVPRESSPLDQALALEKVIQKLIQKVEPSIACVLISRSEGYKLIGQTPPADHPGRLGSFDPDSLDGLPKEEREVLRQKLDLAHPQVIPESFGSGIVLNSQGLILTHYHVVRDATKILIRLPGGITSYADIHAADPRSDLAVLRVLNDKILPLKALPFPSTDNIQRGQFVLSIANPFAAGFRDGQPSASWGIISNVRRRSLGQLREEERTRSLHHYGTLLQIDARLHLGCSGGALFNLKGDLIGVTSSLAGIHGGETPGGFAIPLDPGMQRIVKVLLRGEEVEYGFLGVGFQDRHGEGGPGVLLSYVTPGSPAEQEAKLRVHDRILAINGQTVQDSDDLFLHLGTQLADTRVKLEIRRGNGLPQKVEVTLAKFYVPGKKIVSSLGKRPFVKGLRVDHASLLIQQPPRAWRIPEGVVISEVLPASPAAEAQLKPGDIISHVNGRPVQHPQAFYQAVQNLPGAWEITLSGLTRQDPRTSVTLR